MGRRDASFRVAAATLVVGLAFGAGGTLIGLKLANVSLVPGTGSAAFQKFFSAYNDLHNKYVQPESDTTLLNGAIAGMTNSIGDPFTDYFTPTDAKQFNQMLSGSFVGVGISIEQATNGIEVISVFDNSPAKSAGLKPHDTIVAVNGKSIVGMSLQAASNLVKGPEGSSVTLTVNRPSVPGKPLQFTMKRAKVENPSVTDRMLSGNVGYLQISVVADNTATEVQKALADLKSQGAKSLVLDVRGNPGGYLNVAVDIASQFIPKGKVVVETQNRQGEISKEYSKGPGMSMPVVVLMDQDTASAAEILSGALNEDDGVPLVGTKSFGKGTVQITQGYPDGSSLKFTIDKWLTPKGLWIHKKGLTPTDPVNLPSFVNLPTISSQTLPLKQDENTQSVSVLQKTLQALGFVVDRTDGYFDASTTSAVKLAQKQAGLSQTGVVDSATASHIDAQLQVLISKSDTQLQKAQALAESMQKSQ